MILNKTHQFSDTSTLAAMELWINGVTCFECLFSYYLYILLLLFFICDIYKKKSAFFSQLLLCKGSTLHHISYHDSLGQVIRDIIYHNSTQSQK